jgi:DNA-binding NarL/FixJ family response regulator
MTNNILKTMLISTDPDCVRVLRQVLDKGQDLPFELIHAEDVLTAKDVFEKNEVHLIVLDLSGSQEHGLEQLDQICQNARGIAILVLIDPEDDSLGTQAIKKSAQEYFFKRRVLADANSLIDRIRYTLERQILLGNARAM